MTPDGLVALIGIGLAQLGAMLVLVYRAGQFVQSFKDHSISDDRRFEVIERMIGLRKEGQ